VVIAAAAAVLATTSPAPAQDPERALRIFDCGFLTEIVANQPGPDLTRCAYDPEGEEELRELETYDESPYLDPDRLVDLIRGNIRPDTWHHKKNTIQLRNGQLIVVQTPEVLEEVAEFLRGLRRRVGSRLHLVGRVLSVRLDHLFAGHAEDALSGGAILSRKEVERLLEVPPDDERLEVLGTFSLPARAEQVVHAASVRSTRFIRDLDASAGENAVACEPLLDELLTGIVLTFRASPVRGSMVVLDAHVGRAEPCGAMETVETGVGRVDIPTRALQSSWTTLLVPRGGAALLAVSDAVENGRVIVFLVEPQILGRESGAAATPDGRKPPANAPTRPIRVYDVRFLVSAYPDRPCPYLGSSPGVEISLNPSPEEGGNIFGASAADAGIVYNPEDLIELIRESIDEDSWSNTLNAIDLSNGLMLVVQKPEVHVRIEKLLAELTARRGVLITTQAWALAVGNDRVRELFPDPAALGKPLSPEALARVRQAIADGRAQVLRYARLTSFNQQRANVVSVVERPVIAEMDSKMGKGTVIMDPLIRALRTGFVLDVRPTLVGDGKHLSLDLKARLLTTDPPRRVPYREDEPFVVHEYRAEAATLLVTAYLPDGGAMAFLRGAAPGRPGHQIAYLVTARSTPITGRE